MRTTLLLSLAILLLLLAGAATAQQPAAQRPTVKPVATVKQLMTAIIIPSSDALFQVAGKEPKNDEEWAAVQNSALTLAESGNLLMIGNRAKDRGNWMKESQALVDIGMTAFKAAQAKNVDELTKIGDQIYDVCESCHNKYTDKAKENK